MSPRRFWRSPAVNSATIEIDQKGTRFADEQGKIVQVVGPVVDLEFPEALPGIYHALTVEYKVQNQPTTLTLEVQQHLQNS